MKRRIVLAIIASLVLGAVAPAQVPTPRINSISPQETTAGTATFTLTVLGSNFVTDGVSVVSWGEVLLTTSFLSAGELRATVDASLISTPGTVQVRVVNSKVINSNPVTFTVNPPPTITPDAIPTANVGVPYSQQFGVTGGTGQFSWAQLTGLPPGLGFDSTGKLSGTPTTVGTYPFTIGVTDSVGVSDRRQYTLTVNSAPLAITTASLPVASAGVAYSQTFTATGGTPSYAWSASGLPAGLTLSGGGVLSGTPAQSGTFAFSVTVTDSATASTSRQLILTVNPTVTGISPTQTTAGAASFTLTVTGAGFIGDGVSRVLWNTTQLPLPTVVSSTQLSVPVDASLIKTAGTVQVKVINNGQLTSTSSAIFTINPPLTITTAALLSGTVGVPYSQQFAARDGTAPYTWTATSLPSWLSLTTGGLLSGTPPSAGQSTLFTVTVTDSAGVSAQARYTVTVVVLPAISVSGLASTVDPAQQPSIDVRLGAPYALSLTGTVELGFTPNAVNPSDDPSIQFSTGGRTLNFTIAAGQTQAFPASPPAIQTGTVAGTITLTLRQLSAGGQPVIPVPTLTPSSVTIARAAPRISSVQVVKTSTGFNVLVTGYSTPRQVTQAVFNFTASSGASLQTTQLTVAVDSAFTTWYSGTSSAQFGSSFLYTQPFTVTGSVSSIASVSVTLSNATGSSSAVSANVPAN
jgi:hypothetical protein